MSPVTDRIFKQILLPSRRGRVWRAIRDAREFGTWFGVHFEGPFRAGASPEGHIVPTQVDDDVAAMQRPYEGRRFDCTIERIEPERCFSFRWHPYAVDPDVDYSEEPTTLVVFELEEVPEGTRLTITESGFDQIPPERRARAFEANEGGWTIQLRLLDKYLARDSAMGV